eukprot:4328561-Pyramimonas_sp.AAC.1
MLDFCAGHRDDPANLQRLSAVLSRPRSLISLKRKLFPRVRARDAGLVAVPRGRAWTSDVRR